MIDAWSLAERFAAAHQLAKTGASAERIAHLCKISMETAEAIYGRYNPSHQSSRLHRREVQS